MKKRKKPWMELELAVLMTVFGAAGVVAGINAIDAGETTVWVTWLMTVASLIFLNIGLINLFSWKSYAKRLEWEVEFAEMQLEHRKERE